MARRVGLRHQSRRGSGRAAVGSEATLFVFDRDTATEATIFANESGGVALTQPVSPDSFGWYDVWVSEPGRYDLLETIDGVTLPVWRWEAVSPVMEPWHEVGAAGEPAFQNGWTNFGGVVDTAAFVKNSEGMVFLKGGVAGGTDEAVIFTLPEGFRPRTNQVFAVVSTPTVTRLDVSSVGNVDPVITSNAFISLDNVWFRAGD